MLCQYICNYRDGNGNCPHMDCINPEYQIEYYNSDNTSDLFVDVYGFNSMDGDTYSE